MKVAAGGFRRLGTLRGGAYVLESKLSVESGMGELFRASRARDGTRLAIKRLRRQAATTQEALEDLDLFESEARWLAELRHPAIPRVYEIFSEAGDTWFVMDWIEGRNSEQVLQEIGAWPEDRCLDLLEHLADVLAYIHRHEPPIIHRDLKPANVMITPTQQAVLVDFGIARRGERAVSGRRDTVVFATEDYAPPEQTNKSILRTTPRSDIYALGWTLAHLLTGKSPRSPELGKDPARLRAVLASRLTPSRSWFGEILLRCVEPDPKRRWSDGGELLRALKRAEGAIVPDTTRVQRCGRCQTVFPAKTSYFCEACGALRAVGASEPSSAPRKVKTTFVGPDAAEIKSLESLVRKREIVDPRSLALGESVARLDCSGDFDKLLAEGRLRFEPLPHQIEAVRDVLRHKRGRALLADEVGLGKTIEALIILEEYRLRGLVKKVLILTPPTLVGQWIDELEAKIGIPRSAILRVDTGRSLRHHKEALAKAEVAVGDYQQLKNRANESYLKDEAFDLVIVDEVHMVLSQARNKNKPNPLRGYQLIQSIQKKFVLLLSATPIQNTIVDLYEIVNLTRPGQLLNWSDFRSKYIERYEKRSDGTKFPILREGQELRRLLKSVVIRHRRAEVMTTGVFPRREARMVPLELSPEERNLYDAVRDRLVNDANRPTPRWCLDVADAVASHAESFCAIAQGKPQLFGLTSLAKRIGRSSKMTALIQAVSDLVRKEGRKVLIFSRFPLARREMEAELAKVASVLAFRPGISNHQRVELLRRFRYEGDVMIVDDSAAVGLNLQFCDVVVNYDLPWNPFLIEQRVGRVQRIGQKSESVWILNFRTRDTIDEVKLDLCTARLRMFEGVFGSAPTILGALDDNDFNLARALQEIYLEADARRFREKADRLHQAVERARVKVEEEVASADQVFEEIDWSEDS